MPKNQDIEQVLLSGSSIDELIKKKIDSQISEEMKAAKVKPDKTLITDFSSIDPKDVFSKETTYLVFNRNTKQESFINGIQAESLIGIQPLVREKLVKKQTDSFLTDNYYVKFRSSRVNSAQNQ